MLRKTKNWPGIYAIDVELVGKELRKVLARNNNEGYKQAAKVRVWLKKYYDNPI
jgi:hypothetical protein